MKRVPVIAALLALAAPGAAAVSGCGATGEGDATGAQLPPQTTAAPQPQYEEQAVDKLQRNPTAVDPDAGVRTNFDPDEGAGETDPSKLAKPLTDAQIRAELERSGSPAGTAPR